MNQEFSPPTAARTAHSRSDRLRQPETDVLYYRFYFINLLKTNTYEPTNLSP
jgi:hypothetical protein